MQKNCIFALYLATIKMNNHCSINLNEFAHTGVALCFTVDDAFFEQFGNPDILGGRVVAEVVLNDVASMLFVTLKGAVRVVCDRCLDEFDLPVFYEGNVRLCAARNSADFAITDDVIMVENDRIEMAQYIYESVCLSLPIQRFHSTDDSGNSACNPQMIAKLQSYNI
jgi:uncharacterized metal-binding protein YceD (DUF177 family)